MRNALLLYKTLTKNAEMRMPKKGAKGTVYLSLGIIAASCIMIPCCIIVGFISYIMTTALIEAGNSTAGILAEIHIMSALSMVFGVLVIFNLLFFSSDREHLVPLPFKSYELLAGKFLFSYMAESVMEFMIILSMFIGFFIATIPGIISVLSAIVGVILIPLLPLVYCGILSLIVFGLLKNIHNTKIINHISTLVLIAFAILFLCSFKGIGEITVENYITTLADNSNLFSRVLNKIFFTVPFLLKAIANNSIIDLLIYVVLNIAMFGIMLVLGHLFYQPCLYSVGALGDTKKKHFKEASMIKEKSQFVAYLIKELKVILRTKAYSSNCFYINLLWPAGLSLFLYLNREKEGLLRFRNAIAIEGTNAHAIVGCAIVLLSFIACAMNSVASTAFTREGAHLSLVKYIPVSYKTQMYVKELLSLIISYPPILLTLVILGIYCRLNPLMYLYYALLILLCQIITTIIGLMLDSAAPHSTWDDEYSALRGNLNTFFDMAIMIVISVIIAGIAFALYNFTNISLTIFFAILLILPLIISILCLTIGQKRIIKNMIEM